MSYHCCNALAASRRANGSQAIIALISGRKSSKFENCCERIVSRQKGDRSATHITDFELEKVAKDENIHLECIVGFVADSSGTSRSIPASPTTSGGSPGCMRDEIPKSMYWYLTGLAALRRGIVFADLEMSGTMVMKTG